MFKIWNENSAEKFCYYDFESYKSNMEHYGQRHPPLYNISATAVPVHLMWAKNDYLADPEVSTALVNRAAYSRKELYGREY